MGMARSCLGRRPRPAASVPGEASSSQRRRRWSIHWFPASPRTPFRGSPSYSPTSPSYAPTSPCMAVYSHSPPPAEAYHPRLPRLDDEEEEYVPPLDHDDDEYAPQLDDGDDDEYAIGDERPGSEGGVDEDYYRQEEEEEHDDHDDDYDVEIEEEKSGGERVRQVFSFGSDGENGVEDDEQREEEAPAAPQPHDVQGNDVATAVDGQHALLPQRPASPPASWSESSSGGVGEMTVTVERTELDCGICFLPLKAPIFQCDVGHVVCSPCRDRLPAGGRCHVCRSTSGFRRCHAMEHLVESIRVPCPHAAHGCAVRPAYHGRERHARECPHAPCRCPGHGCGFRGTTAALVEHLVADHGWPCTAEASADRSFGVDLRDGFNFLTAVRGSDRYLLLLDMSSTAFGRAISAVWIGSHAAATAAVAGSSNTMTCRLELTCSRFEHFPSGHWQSSKFEVACTDPSNGGLPDPNDSFQFFVPKYVGGGSGEATVHATAVISIRYIINKQMHGSENQG